MTQDEWEKEAENLEFVSFWWKAGNPVRKGRRG